MPRRSHDRSASLRALVQSFLVTYVPGFLASWAIPRIATDDTARFLGIEALAWQIGIVIAAFFASCFYAGMLLDRPEARRAGVWALVGPLLALWALFYTYAIMYAAIDS